MLTDIFAHRYLDVVIWEEFDENARRLLVQTFRIVSEQLFPYYQSDGKTAHRHSKATWDGMNKKLAMELGLYNLTNPSYGYWSEWNGKKHWFSGSKLMVTVCQGFVCADYDGKVSADQFIKERLSFIEIAFRRRSEQVAEANASLNNDIGVAKIEDARRRANKFGSGMRSPDQTDSVLARNAILNNEFRDSCKELNARFRQAGTGLDYHNGFIQLSSGKTLTDQIEEPFWNLVSTPLWKNVDHDLKEAIDLRDNGGRDPAWYAAKALESTIKIVSERKGWTTGRENGASNFIDNLRAKKNGEFICGWEQESLTGFFRSVRNPFGHGSGSDEMPELSSAQTDWAIEFCMVWIKNLIRRM